MVETPNSRRTFLAATAAAAVAPSISWATPAGPRGRAHRLKVGLASYSLRKLSLDQVLDACKDADIAYINLKTRAFPSSSPPPSPQPSTSSRR